METTNQVKSRKKESPHQEHKNTKHQKQPGSMSVKEKLRTITTEYVQEISKPNPKKCEHPSTRFFFGSFSLSGGLKEERTARYVGIFHFVNRFS
jgi:hypothetical protein